MRAIIIAGALVAAATGANAAEPGACYDAVVIGSMPEHANSVLLDRAPVPPDRILPRVEADTLILNWSQVAGATMPDAFWARTVETGWVDPATTFLIYLKNRPDGAPFVVGYRYAPTFFRDATPSDYPPC